MVDSDLLELRIDPPMNPLPERVMAALGEALRQCPDVAFAHLPEVAVEHSSDGSNLVLFVWLRGEALRSLRAALNFVSEQVASALPADRFVDVVILNSAPELLERVEAAGCLVVECDAEERARARNAARSGELVTEASAQPWWWPF